jgi:hypothetical protein
MPRVPNPSEIIFKYDHMFVVTESDLIRMLTRFREAKDILGRIAGTLN